MPKYSQKLTVPAARTILNPVLADLKVGQGIISQVTVTWSPGSWWLNALVVKYEGGQIIPSSGGGQCRGDGVPDTWPEHIILSKVHPVLNLEAYNDGNTYEQDVLIDIVVLPLLPDTMRPIRDMVSLIKRIIGI